MKKNPEKEDRDSPIDSEERFTLLSPAMAAMNCDYSGFFDTPADNLVLVPKQEQPGKRGNK